MRQLIHNPLLVRIAGSMGLKVVAVLVGFGLNVVVARTMGAAEAGLYFWFFSAITLASVVSRQGFDRIVVRSHAGNYIDRKWAIPILQRKVEKSILLFSIPIGFLFLFAGKWFVVNVLNKPEVGQAVEYGGVVLVFLALLQNLTEAYKGIERIYLGLALWGIVYPATNALLILFLNKNQGLSGLGIAGHEIGVISLTLSAGLTWITARLLWWGFTHSWVPKHRDEVIKLERKESSRLFQVALMEFGVNMLPTFLMGALVMSGDIAIFESARRTSLLMAFFLVAFNSVLSPRIAGLHSKGNIEAIKRLSNKSTLLLVILTTPLLIGIGFFPSQIMSLFGKEFTSGSLELLVLSAGQFFNVICGPVGIILVMGKKDKEKLRATFLGFAIMLILCLVLIPIMGILGGAIAVASGVVLQNLMSVIYVKKSFGFFPIPQLR